jgi:hypothetical protein
VQQDSFDEAPFQRFRPNGLFFSLTHLRKEKPMTRPLSVRLYWWVFLGLGSFLAVSHLSARAGTISVDPGVGLDEAIENSGERNILVTVTNTSEPSTAVNIREIVADAPVNGAATFVTGERDDAAIFTGLTLPQSPPFALNNKGDTFNFRVKWKPVDLIIDNDVDFGSWKLVVRVGYDVDSSSTSILLLNVLDIPEPGTLSLLAWGALVALCRRRRAREV